MLEQNILSLLLTTAVKGVTGYRMQGSVAECANPREPHIGKIYSTFASDAYSAASAGSVATLPRTSMFTSMLS